MSEVTFTSHLGDFKDALTEDKIPKILETIGLIAEGYAKRLCPVDTGRLRNSISHASDFVEKAEYIGTNVIYAPYVELGTSKQKPQPYLRPAVQDHAEEYKSIVESALKA